MKTVISRSSGCFGLRRRVEGLWLNFAGFWDLRFNYKCMKLTVSWGTTTDVFGTLNPTPKPPAKPWKGKQVQGLGLKGLGLVV